MSGDSYEMRFSYSSRAVITSFKQSGFELLGASGIFSAVNNNGTWVTTEALPISPSVSVAGNVVTATLSTSIAVEVWTFTVTAASVEYRVSRTYNGSFTVTEQGTPMLHFGQDVIDNIRWNDSGGNFPINGPAVSDWFSMTSSNRANMRAGMEQIEQSRTQSFWGK